MHGVHPKGSTAKTLLTSVFGPYAQDDDYGSRKINPMELWHNQVTRVQGPFSLRMFNRSYGLMFIQANLNAPCTLLDFPTLDRFVQEIRENQYDIVGIGSITINLLKVKKMCQLVRQHLPDATIVVGGHIANMPELENRVDADIIVKGEGVRWFRGFLGEDQDRPIRHPHALTFDNFRNLGITVEVEPCDRTATLVPSVGCPMGCNFCITSAMFGGKGKFVDFYETGDELFEIVCHLEETMNVHSFFVMDENFLFHRRRALRLLELMERHDKAWSFHVFSSANVLSMYSIDQLLSLGLSWVWMGLEGEDSQYAKLKGVDTFSLVRKLQSHGVRVLGSTIIGLENHTLQNIDEVIDYAVKHDTDFHQFMLYTALPGTPLHAELRSKGLLRDEIEAPPHDHHGQYRFNYLHPHITEGQESDLLVRAFKRDFAVNGPSVVRVVQTLLKGWRQYKDHPDPRLRRRISWESRDLLKHGVPMVAASQRYYQDDPKLHAKMSRLLQDLFDEFGSEARRFAEVAGPYVLQKIREEENRLDEGWSYEPPTFYEQNTNATALIAQKQPQRN